MPDMMVRVLIVDDQGPFRLAARMVVEATDGFEVVGESETGEDSIEKARELHPNLVLMDVNLPGIAGPTPPARSWRSPTIGSWSCSCPRRSPMASMRSARRRATCEIRWGLVCPSHYPRGLAIGPLGRLGHAAGVAQPGRATAS